jgi:hypothetical protein
MQFVFPNFAVKRFLRRLIELGFCVFSAGRLGQAPAAHCEEAVAGAIFDAECP